MDIVVNDTNIFLDLYDAGLLDAFFSLPYQVHTVDFVINEIVNVNQQEAIQRIITEGHLTVKQYSQQSIADLFQFHTECGGNLSITDSTVLHYALSLSGCRILTGDRQLRNRAVKRGIPVSGILFVFDQLIEHGILTPREASLKLEKLFKINTRLPKHEVDSRIERWRG